MLSISGCQKICISVWQKICTSGFKTNSTSGAKRYAPLALENMHLFLSKICNSGSQMKKIDLMNMVPKKIAKTSKTDATV